MRFVLACSTVSVLTLAAAAGADTITITTATGSSQDTYVRRNSTTNLINDRHIAIKKQGESEAHSNDRIGLLKFDLSSIPDKGAVSQATLTLQTSDGNNNGNAADSFHGGNTIHLYGIPDGHAQENWNGSLITFANLEFTTGAGGHHPRPGVDTAINSIDDTMAILLGQYTFSPAVQHHPIGTVFSITSIPLAQFIAASTTNYASFMLVAMTDATFQFPTVHSAQSTTPGAIIPTLTLETAGGIGPSIPEPATLGLVGLGAMALAMRRRG